MRSIFLLFVGLFLWTAGCTSFTPYTTVTTQNDPPSRTLVTHIKAHEVGESAGKNIHDYMNRLAVKVPTDEGVTMVPFDQAFYISILSTLWFDAQSHSLKPSAKCDAALKALKDTKHTQYLVEVHTHDEGSRYYNQGLTERRMESLKAYFKEQGFALDRMTFKAYGEDQPVADNSTAWGKQFNQRIEIAVVANDELKKLAAKGPVFE